MHRENLRSDRVKTGNLIIEFAYTKSPYGLELALVMSKGQKTALGKGEIVLSST